MGFPRAESRVFFGAEKTAAGNSRRLAERLTEFGRISGPA